MPANAAFSTRFHTILPKASIPAPRDAVGGFFDRMRGDPKDIIIELPQTVVPYLEHIKEVVSAFNDAFKLAGVPLHMDASHILNADPELLLDNKEVSNFLRGEDKGRTYPNQIYTFVDVLKEVCTNPGKSGMCIGVTQCGKTGTANNCYWLAPILSMVTGRPYIVHTWLPNKKGVERQSDLEFKRYLGLYGKLVISWDGKRIGLSQYYHNISAKLDGQYDITAKADENNSSSPMKRRTGGKGFRKVSAVLERTRNLGMTNICLIDEFDWGAGAGGVQDQMMKLTNIWGRFVKQFGSGDFMIGFSATPFQTYFMKNFWRVNHRLTDGYCGWNHFGGRVIDPLVDVPAPEVMSFLDIEQKLGIPGFASIHKTAMLKQSAFDKIQQQHQRLLKKLKENGDPAYLNGTARDANGRMFFDFVKSKYGNTGSWDKLTYQQYVSWCIRAIAVLINYCLVYENPKNEKGFLFRLKNDNNFMRGFTAELAKFLKPEIEVIEYFASEVQDSIENVIRRREDPNRPYLIVVTGAARMADHFRAEVKYGLELVEQATTWRAALQGILGRLTGHGKISPVPLVVVSPKLKAFIDNYVRTGGEIIRNPSPSQMSAIDVVDNRGAPKKSLDVTYDDMTTPALKRAWIALAAEVRKNQRNRPKLRGGRFPIWNIFNDKILGEIETVLNTRNNPDKPKYTEPVEFLRPGDLDSEGSGYVPVDENGWGKIGFRRNTDPHGKRGLDPGRHPSARSRPGGKSRDPKNPYRMEPQLWCVRTRQGWELVAVQLLLVRPTKPYMAGRYLPDERCAYYDGLLDEEKADLEAKNA